ncbi:MAG TPA: ABC transporter ATP-binding protein [Aestuariivirgaceae bacterium]|nr:ABC transporter ATP-binding protein [Aestuariivirgaceae bacterium]
MSDHDFIRLQGVAKSWGSSVGVERIDLEIGRGEFTVLLGPSGCGKSTTLRLIAGLELPDAGTLTIAGRDVTHLPPSRRDLSMVFQSYALFPHLDVAENIVFGLRVRRVPAAQRRERLSEALRLTGLDGLEARKPAQLSGGQRQRVALARAIVAGHPLCLMDEPLSNLDAKLRHSVRQDIRTLQRDLKMTVVYVTHDQTEAMGMADRIVLLNKGRVEQVGTPADLYQRPATSFAATFVGSPPMSLLPMAEVPDSLRPTGIAADAPLVVGVRPEHLALGPDDPKHLPARVDSYEFLGAETLVYLESHNTSLVARVPGIAEFAYHQAVGVSWAPEHAHVFDEASGRRVDVTGDEAGANVAETNVDRRAASL